jgi:hypothetical protein
MKNDRYEMWNVGWEVFVRELKTGRLVAYSMMQADFEQSYEEFTYDYDFFIEGE